MRDKQRNKHQEQREDGIWYNLELSLMDRYDQIENLNSMARKNKALDEKKKREHIIHQRNEQLRIQHQSEVDEDRD